jgi:hypothetical protein
MSTNGSRITQDDWVEAAIVVPRVVYWPTNLVFVLLLKLVILLLVLSFCLCPWYATTLMIAATMTTPSTGNRYAVSRMSSSPCLMSVHIVLIKDMLCSWNSVPPCLCFAQCLQIFILSRDEIILYGSHQSSIVSGVGFQQEIFCNELLAHLIPPDSCPDSHIVGS